MSTLTPERVAELMTQAYKTMGYEVFRFRDGSKGVLRCPAKTVALMTKFGDLICGELESTRASAQSADAEPGTFNHLTGKPVLTLGPDDPCDGSCPGNELGDCSHPRGPRPEAG